MSDTSRKTASQENCKSKIKRGKKRKRTSSESTNDDDVGELPANILEVEKNLQAIAAKNNLNNESTKKLLKNIVLNDHVLALVKLQEEEQQSANEDEEMGPKLTRAKAKELKKPSPNWSLTPIDHIPVKTRPEVEALIAQELPDESDEEYQLTHDDVQSDEDQTSEFCSDVDSQPRTPATPRSQPTSSPKSCAKDGPFKVPQETRAAAKKRLQMEEEEATIALRTRSKLSLSGTPIEHIESSFVPPDEAPVPVVDDLWNQFLKECLNPAPGARNEDDDEADPEYNVAADPDAQDEDELEGSLVKISKKELTDLLSELMHLMPEGELDDLQTPNAELAGAIGNEPFSQCGKWEGKQEVISEDETGEVNNANSEFRQTPCVSIGKSEPMSDEDTTKKLNGITNEVSAANDVDNVECIQSNSRNATQKNVEQEKKSTIENSATVRIRVGEHTAAVTPPEQTTPLPRLLKESLERSFKRQQIEIRLNAQCEVIVLPDQVEIFQQQLRQHIQLATSNFLQLYVHPIHWSRAPIYKEYLEAFQNIVRQRPNSLVKVCNLEPAIELVNSWEKSVSEDTPVNVEMVKFLEKEAEKSMRRIANNSMYLGHFHPTFQQAVANSRVFVYPYLLPPVPYRPDGKGRSTYLRCEDELIALGLDQFWQFVTDNPKLYKRPKRVPANRRFGLGAVIELVCRHMFPWMTQRILASHISHVRRLRDPDNPINRFFNKREITPVKHKLLSYNENMTLHEQPEHEMPLIWVRYLSTRSSRAKLFLSRRAKISGAQPQGVDIDMGDKVKPPHKEPLPVDFSKMLVRNAKNQLVPIKPKCTQEEPIKIQINTGIASQNNGTTQTGYLIPLNLAVLNQNTGVVNSIITPITISKECVQQDQVPVINLSAMMGTNRQPSITQEEKELPTTTQPERKLVNEPTRNVEHCKCCVMIRGVVKRQTTIGEFFKPKGGATTTAMCPCRRQCARTPKISDRLRMLVRNFNLFSVSMWRELAVRIDDLSDICSASGAEPNSKKSCQSSNIRNATTCDISLEDLAFVTTFLLKMIIRTNCTRNVYLKKRIMNLFTRFDIDNDSPVYLYNQLEAALQEEVVDLAREFVCFLTPDQALKADRYKDYFFMVHLPLLTKRIEDEITDARKRLSLFTELKSLTMDSARFTPCDVCQCLLKYAKDREGLAEYIFYLFPHRSKDGTLNTTAETKINKTEIEEETKKDSFDEKSHNGDHYEADESASDQENVSVTMDCGEPGDWEEKSTDNNKNSHNYNTDSDLKNMQTEDISVDNPDPDDSENDSLTIVCDSDAIKFEVADWSRDEDKLVLEFLKQSLTPEEIKDKTIVEILEEKSVYELISNSLAHKSSLDIRNRVLYLLDLLNGNT